MEPANPTGATPALDVQMPGTTTIEEPFTVGQPSGAHTKHLEQLGARFLLLIGSLALVAAPLVAHTYRAAFTPYAQLGSLLLLLLLGVVLVGASVALRRGHVRAAYIAVLSVSFFGVVSYALLTQIGGHTVTSGFFLIIIAAASVLLSARWAIGFGTASVMALIGLYFAEVTGFIAGKAALLAVPTSSRILAMLLVIVGGTVLAVMFARLVVNGLRASLQQEHRFRALLSIASDWYWEQNQQGCLTQISSSAQATNGVHPDADLGRPLWALNGVDLAASDWAAHRADIEAHRRFRDFRYFRTHPDGRRVAISVSGEPLFDAKGHFDGYWGVASDVTEEERARAALRTSDQRFRELFMLSPSPFILHRQGRVLVGNRAAAMLFGFAELKDFEGFDLALLTAPEDRALSRQRIAALENVPVGSAVPTVELKMLRLDGAPLSVEARVVRVELVDGPASLSLYIDLTEYKRTEAELRQSRTMLSHLFQASPDYITVSDIDTGKLEMVNEGFERLTGYRIDEAVGRTVFELGLWPYPEQREAMRTAIHEHGIVHDVPASLRRRDGQLRKVLFSGARFEVEGRLWMVATARDVTESERARLEYGAILANASIGIAFTRDRVFQHVNPRFEDMFGWTPGSLAGQSGSVVWLSEDDFIEIGHKTAPALERGEFVDLERRMRRKDGSEFWCRLMGRAVDPSHPSRGGTIWIAEDVTERRATQEALASAKADAESASQAKSAFLANTSHEIRTPLNGLLGLARLACDAKTSEAQRMDYLKGILSSAQQLSGLISDILDLSKIEAGKFILETVTFDLQALLENVYAGYRELAAEKGLACALHLSPTLPRYVRGDPLRVRQIISNFVSNALKFTEHGHIDLCAERLPDGQVRLAVVDTGLGVDAGTQARLFTPFTQADESTTRRFGGTGLGLSICRQLAQLMGGQVGVDSEPGAGSTFWAQLPFQTTGAPEQEPAEAEDISLTGVRVLLVEDNAVNMLIAATMLENWGANVTQATDGQQAIERVAQTQNNPRLAFDVVLMDMHMPVMSGREATIALRQQFSAEQLPIVALTAAALLNEQEASMALGMNDFITKPLDAKRLRAVVARWGMRQKQT